MLRDIIGPERRPGHLPLQLEGRGPLVVLGKGMRSHTQLNTTHTTHASARTSSSSSSSTRYCWKGCRGIGGRVVICDRPPHRAASCACCCAAAAAAAAVGPPLLDQLPSAPLLSNRTSLAGIGSFARGSRGRGEKGRRLTAGGSTRCPGGPSLPGRGPPPRGKGPAGSTARPRTGQRTHPVDNRQAYPSKRNPYPPGSCSCHRKSPSAHLGSHLEVPKVGAGVVGIAPKLESYNLLATHGVVCGARSACPERTIIEAPPSSSARALLPRVAPQGPAAVRNAYI